MFWIKLRRQLTVLVIEVVTLTLYLVIASGFEKQTAAIIAASNIVAALKGQCLPRLFYKQLWDC